MRMLVVVAVVVAVTVTVTVAVAVAMGVVAVVDWVFLFGKKDIHKESKEREKKR